MVQTDRETRLSVLGLQRLRLLDCLGCNQERSPHYFDPPTEDDIFQAFNRHISHLSRQLAEDTYSLTISLLAAARLLTGDILAASLIIDNLPTEPVKLDHGAGYCLVAPVYALNAALPLPESLDDTKRWLAKSLEQAALRDWLAKHAQKLKWIEAEGRYFLPLSR